MTAFTDPVTGEVHDDRFVINDIVLSIPPTEIQISKQPQNFRYQGLRSKASTKVKSGHSLINITFRIPFVGEKDINEKLRPLLAQFRLTPFCAIENEHIRNTILGNSGENMALCLSEYSIITEEEFPDTIWVSFSFIWFNYYPFSTSFLFKKEFDRAEPVVSLSGALENDIDIPWNLYWKSILSQFGTWEYPSGQSTVAAYPLFATGSDRDIDEVKEEYSHTELSLTELQNEIETISAKIQKNDAENLFLYREYALDTALSVTDSDIIIDCSNIVDKAAITDKTQNALGAVQVAFSANDYGWALRKGIGLAIPGAALSEGDAIITGDDTEGEVIAASTTEGPADAQYLGVVLAGNANADTGALVRFNIS